MIFLPALDWLVVGGMIGACILIVIMAFLLNPPTALVKKFGSKEEE